jgi:hypothetical protein
MNIEVHKVGINHAIVAATSIGGVSSIATIDGIVTAITIEDVISKGTNDCLTTLATLDVFKVSDGFSVTATDRSHACSQVNGDYSIRKGDTRIINCIDTSSAIMIIKVDEVSINNAIVAIAAIGGVSPSATIDGIVTI